MREADFDTLVRGADTDQGRRHALKILGAAALAAAAGAPLATEAKKNNKNKNKKKRRKNRGEQVCPECPADDCTREAEEAATERCQSQVAVCEILAQAQCGDDAECLLAFRECCDALGACDTAGFFTCLTSAN